MIACAKATLNAVTLLRYHYRSVKLHLTHEMAWFSIENYGQICFKIMSSIHQKISNIQRISNLCLFFPSFSECHIIDIFVNFQYTKRQLTVK